VVCGVHERGLWYCLCSFCAHRPPLVNNARISLSADYKTVCHIWWENFLFPAVQNLQNAGDTWDSMFVWRVKRGFVEDRIKTRKIQSANIKIELEDRRKILNQEPDLANNCCSESITSNVHWLISANVGVFGPCFCWHLVALRRLYSVQLQNEGERQSQHQSLSL
jgi:hypothetical protein